MSSSISYPQRNDRILAVTLKGLALLAGLITVLIFYFLMVESFPLIRDVGFLTFFSSESWHPTEGLYNLTPMLWGTLYASFGAVLLAAPLGIMSAIYCRFYGHRKIVGYYRRMVELMAGIPSVVYGFWGLTVLVPWINRFQPPGASLLAAILVLTIMILPTMALAADAAFDHVPKSDYYGAQALGLSHWTLLSRVILPRVKPALWTGLLLQVGRALGETMAVLMVAGNVIRTPESLFDPIRTLAANVALEMAYALGSHRAALFVSGLILILMVTGLVAAAQFFDRGRAHAQF